MVGGHQYGHIYIGAIGLISTYFFHGRDKAKHLVQNCINCGACKAVCAAGIDLPRLIKEVHARIQDEEGHPLPGRLLALTLKNRKLFHGLLRSASKTQKPITGGTPYLRHLPYVFYPEHNFRALPAIAETPFRDRWPTIQPNISRPRFRIALFSGCVQDFVYPEQLEAAVHLLARHRVALEFPMDQSCCGLPVQMMGEKAAARDVARQNMAAVDHRRFDYIVTLCASCASHLKHGYAQAFADNPDQAAEARAFGEKVLTFTQFTHRVLKLEPEAFQPSQQAVTYHAPCHLCRGLGEREAHRALLRDAGFDFKPAAEEETCCGFGGTYSGKFPEISSQILKRKLDDFEATGADLLVTECPGCVMQLRGGAERAGHRLEVRHIAEVLCDRLTAEDASQHEE
jgi:Fe-S oxidoreductase